MTNLELSSQNMSPIKVMRTLELVGDFEVEHRGDYLPF